MSYTRTAIATAFIIFSLSAATPGARPAAASQELAGHAAQEEISDRPALQAPDRSPEPVFITTIHAETSEQQDTAEWALEAMAAAGFDLPPVTIHMHSNRSDCSNEPGGESNGYYTHTEYEHIIHSCGSPWVLVHELAHVWDKTSLDDKTRAIIIEHQGLETWSNEVWNQAAGEHLASIIAWAIEGTHPTAIGYYDRNHLAEAYTLATGRDLPGAEPTRRQRPVAATQVLAGSADSATLAAPEFE